MHKKIALFLAMMFIINLVGCSGRPDVMADMELDRVTMLYSCDGDATSEKVTITDQETISELLAMHNSLQTRGSSRPIAEERMWVIFCQGEEHIIEWCISAYEEDEVLITCSNMLGMGNHVIKSELDFERVVALFDAAKS